MKPSDIDSDYITRRTTVTPAMADEFAALNEERQEEWEERQVELEAVANQGLSPSYINPKAPVLAGEPHKNSDKAPKDSSF